MRGRRPFTDTMDAKRHRIHPLTLALPPRVDVERALSVLASCARAVRDHGDPRDQQAARETDVTVAWVEERVLPRCLTLDHLERDA